jgi:hypothetical protein
MDVTALEIANLNRIHWHEIYLLNMNVISKAIHLKISPIAAARRSIGTNSAFLCLFSV